MKLPNFSGLGSDFTGGTNNTPVPTGGGGPPPSPIFFESFELNGAATPPGSPPGDWPP